MGVIFTHDLSDGLGRFSGLFVGSVAHLVHAVKHTAVNRFQSVADVGEGARDNHGHRIIDVSRFHLVLDVDFNNSIFFEHF